MPLCAKVMVLVVSPKPQLAPGSCPNAEFKLETNSSFVGTGPAFTFELVLQELQVTAPFQLDLASSSSFHHPRT